MQAAGRLDSYVVRIPRGADPRPLKAFVNAMGWSASVDDVVDDAWNTMPGQFSEEEKLMRLAEVLASDDTVSHEAVCKMAATW